MDLSGPDELLGCPVEICSSGGIVYQGIVHRIEPAGDGAELFTLGSDDPEYQRIVYVTDRAAQVRS